MRTHSLPVALLLALLVAGCASPEPVVEPTAEAAPLVSPTPSASPEPMPSPTSTPSPTDAPRLGVIFEETYDYQGKTDEVRRNFTVDRGVDKLFFYVESAGPPADRSFTSAVMDVYAPRSTGAMFAELPGQQKHNYTRELTTFDPYWGTWMVRFAGTGATSVTLRVTAE